MAFKASSTKRIEFIQFLKSLVKPIFYNSLKLNAEISLFISITNTFLFCQTLIHKHVVFMILPTYPNAFGSI